MKLSVRNILRVYRSATFEQQASGLEWYVEANGVANTLDPTNVVRGAAVLAVLSPQTSWSLNVDYAVDAYAGRKFGNFGANVVKVLRLLGEENPDDVVGGQKVISFWKAIVNPNDPHVVVIDRHAFDVAAGYVTNMNTRRFLERKGNYELVANLYRRAAAILTKESGHLVTPLQVQAVTWTVWRETRIRTAAANRRERESGKSKKGRENGV